jgi:chromosome segregation ATPase
MRNHRCLIALALSLILIHRPALCPAGYGSKSGGGGGGGGPSSTPPVDRSASTAARKQLAEATTEFNKASRAATEIVTHLRQESQHKPEWTKAQTVLKSDQAKLEAARNAVTTRLEKDASYLSLKSAKSKADADREASAKDPGATAEERQAAAQAALAASAACSKRLSEAVQSDSAVLAAQAQVAEDTKKTSALLAEYDAAAKQTPEYQAALAIADQKQQTVTEARKSLASALAAESLAERNR